MKDFALDSDSSVLSQSVNAEERKTSASDPAARPDASPSPEMHSANDAPSSADKASASSAIGKSGRTSAVPIRKITVRRKEAVTKIRPKPSHDALETHAHKDDSSVKEMPSTTQQTELPEETAKALSDKTAEVLSEDAAKTLSDKTADVMSEETAEVHLETPLADENEDGNGCDNEEDVIESDIEENSNEETAEDHSCEDEGGTDKGDAIKEKDSVTPKAPVSHAIFEWLELFVCSLAVVLILMTFFVRHSPVNGSSMNPTLSNGDVLLISNLGYTPKAGDIVILQTPQDDLRRPLVKRIIALGGQTIRIDFEKWEVYVDGELLKEDYINRVPEPMKLEQIKLFFTKVDPAHSVYEATVPEGYLFVMGDNRNDSKDSRFLGFIDERYVIGDVKFRLLPFSSLGAVD